MHTANPGRHCLRSMLDIDALQDLSGHCCHVISLALFHVAPRPLQLAGLELQCGEVLGRDEL